MAGVCGNINLDKDTVQNLRNGVTFTKKQQYAKAVRGELTAQDRTSFASQNKFGTYSNIYNLTKVPNTNILLLTNANCQ